MPALLQRANHWLMSRPARTIERLLFACVVLFAWGLDTHGTHTGSGDAPHYEMIAHSLVFDFDLDLADEYADPTNLAGFGNLKPEAHALPGKDGRLRPVHDIGLPFLFSPYFALAYWAADHSPEWIPPWLMARARLSPGHILRHLLSLGMIVVTAFMAVVLFRTCQLAHATRNRAFLWTLLFALSPPLLSHSIVFFSEIPTALIVAVCWLFLSRPSSISRWQAAALGAAVGFLLLLHIRNVGLVLGLIGLFVVQMRRLRQGKLQVALFLAPIAGIAAIRTAVNFMFWGTLVTNPHVAVGPVDGVTATAKEVATRALGLLLDGESGLLPYAPIYLAVLAGFLLLRKIDSKSFREASLLILAYLAPVLVPSLNRHGWDGGWSPAARFLVPVAPILLTAGFTYAARLRTLPVGLMVLGLGQVALDLVYWSRPKLLWSLPGGRNALAARLSGGSIDVAAWLPCWHTRSLYTVAVSLLILVVWTAVSMRAANRCWRMGREP